MDAYVTLGLGIIATVLAGCAAVAARFGSLVAFGSIACALGSLTGVIWCLWGFAQRGDGSGFVDTVGAFLACALILDALVLALLALALMREHRRHNAAS